MGCRKDLITLAHKLGFELIRSKKHFVYKRKSKMVIIPNHNKINKFT